MSDLLVILWLVWVKCERIAAAALLLRPGNDTCRDAQVFRRPRTCGVVRATRQGELTLLNGFTIVRDLGTEGSGSGDVSLRRAPESGKLVNARVFYPDEWRRVVPGKQVDWVAVNGVSTQFIEAIPNGRLVIKGGYLHRTF